MSGYALYQFGVIAIFILAVVTFFSLTFITAPYGRHHRIGWGINLPNRLGWIIMEIPAVVLFALVYYYGLRPENIVAILLFCLWQFHYLHRTFVYPLRMKTNSKSMPLLIAFFGFTFNCLNAYINAYYLVNVAEYHLAWIYSPRFILGVAIFLLGFYINYRSDAILFRLRKKGETGYKIPHGFLFEWICAPNYLGEIIEWTGFAIAAWSLPALGFALYTAANLVPRALAHQQWYRRHFDNFPSGRKAIIPFLL